jgi:excinuclease UvrABC ATPase subunit
MAMASTGLCPNCDKQEGIVPCLGCKKIFCVKHFQIHRQNLSVELEYVVTRRNTLQEYYCDRIASTLDPTKFDAWNTIDEWEQAMKEQVGRTADQARKQLDMYSKQSRSQIEQQLNQMTENIQQKMERENFIEEDIEKLTQQIDQMEEGIQNNKYHPQIEIISQPIDWNASLQVKLLVENVPKIEQQEKPPTPPPVTAPVVTPKPKYPPSIQHKCYTCGTGTWQKECKCCAHIYCGWHLKRHAIESKKH